MRRVHGKDIAPPLNPGACIRTERFAVFVETEAGPRLVETQPDAGRAQHACDILNACAKPVECPPAYRWAEAPEIN